MKPRASRGVFPGDQGAIDPATPRGRGALRPGLDLHRPLAEVAELGAVLVDHALDPPFLRDLARSAAGLPFQRMAAEEGRARQGGEFHVIPAPFASVRAVQLLGDDLADHVHAAEPGSAGWAPNEVYVQRYRTGDLGITPHLDLKRYRYLVAIFTAAGEAEFVLSKDREGSILRSWITTPGSLILLRAPGFGGVDDGRPLHAVRGPGAGERISVSYRMDVSRTR